MEVQLHAFLTSALNGGQLHTPAILPPGERDLVTHWIGAWNPYTTDDSWVT